MIDVGSIFGVSQITTVTKNIINNSGEIPNNCLNTVSNVVNFVPVVGHVKGLFTVFFCIEWII